MSTWDKLTAKWSRLWHNRVCRLCVDTPIPSVALICPDCHALFQSRIPSPLPVAPELVSPELKTQNGKRPFKLHAACIMTPELKQRLYPFKFYNRHQHLPALTALWLNYFEQWQAQQPDNSVWQNPEHIAITTIPSRYAKYSQGHISPLLKQLALYTGATPLPHLFSWNRETKAQHTVTKRAHRLNNLRNSLMIEPQNEALLKQTNALIVMDDITTTGATLHATHSALEHYFTQHPNTRIPVINLALCYVPFASDQDATYNQATHQHARQNTRQNAPLLESSL